MGYLTTHILDNTRGVAASGVTIELYQLAENGARNWVSKTISNTDGRCDTPLLEGDAFQTGCYELAFSIGDYFEAQGVESPEPRFLDVVVLRFGISDKDSHYHVPLLVTPYSYSTYRGS